MKKELSCFLLIFLSTITYADGFYVGLGAGRDTATINKKLTLDDVNTGVNHYYKNDNQPGYGYLGNLFAGYAGNFNNIYLAGELNGATSSLKYHGYFVDKENDEQSEANYSINKSYGASLLAGYHILDSFLIYGRLGSVKSNFKYSEYKTEPSSGDTTGATEWSWLNGFRYGLVH